MPRGVDEEAGQVTRQDRSSKTARSVFAFACAAFLMSADRSAARDMVRAACTAEGGEAVRIAVVQPDLTLRLDDGRQLRLVGVDASSDPTHPEFARDRQTRLGQWLEGRTVHIQALAAAADRWNRWPALVFATTDAAQGAELPVAHALVDAGLARARPDEAIHACWVGLLAAEQGARAAGLGLWAFPAFAIRHIDASGGVAATMGRMTIVEGRVARVTRGRAATYLTFGGRRGVSLRVPRRIRGAPGHPDLTDAVTIGTNVRVRGILDDRFGPTIDVTSADQIEVLPANDAAAPNGPRP